jgi:hypothetical protein
MDVCLFISVLCCPVEIAALLRADPPSKESYQLSKQFIIPEVILNWNRSLDLIRIANGGGGRATTACYQAIDCVWMMIMMIMTGKEREGCINSVLRQWLR